MKKIWMEISPLAVAYILVKIGTPLWVVMVVALAIFFIYIPAAAIYSFLTIKPDPIEEEKKKILSNPESKEYLARYMPKA